MSRTCCLRVRTSLTCSQLETNPKGSKSGPGAGGTAGSHDVDVNAPAANGASDAKPAAKAPKPNTAIFVTGLPIDADRDDLRAYFSKFGVIKESADDDEKRIIMYNDDEGNFKGEALISKFAISFHFGMHANVNPQSS